MPKRKSIDEKLEELDALTGEDRPAYLAAVATALADRHARIVSKAARLAAESLLYKLERELVTAYRRFLEQPVKRDPNCLAKQALVRALVELDSTDTQFFIDALRYRQPEPVWDGSMDTAVELRCSAAMGLVATGYPRALVEVAELLYDPEAPARAGAARAIACGHPGQAELLLRAKVLAGDADPSVIGECFGGLLAVEPDESPDFVARFLIDADEAIRELAALALGESRTETALPHLLRAWDDVLLAPGFRRALIRAAALHRSDDAFHWLLALVAAPDRRVAEDVVEVLAMYKHNERLAARLRAAVAERGDGTLETHFEMLWQ
jgi:HEAT repeat protein